MANPVSDGWRSSIVIGPDDRSKGTGLRTRAWLVAAGRRRESITQQHNGAVGALAAIVLRVPTHHGRGQWGNPLAPFDHAAARLEPDAGGERRVPRCVHVVVARRAVGIAAGVAIGVADIVDDELYAAPIIARTDAEVG